MKNLLFGLLILFFSCTNEEEMTRMIPFEGSTYNYVNSECDNSKPELNQCTGFIFFQSKNNASGLLDGKDIVSEYRYKQGEQTLTLILVKGNATETSEDFLIENENILIRKSDNTLWERAN